jgi:alkylation response protein AidB-like acyl-CoA dehydrogenase
VWGNVDFRLDEGQVALQEAVAGFCSSRLPLDSIGERESPSLPAGLWPELAELGVFSLLVPEADGGLGLGVAEATLVFEQLGRHLVVGPLVWSALAPTLVDGVLDGSKVVGGHDASTLADDPIVVEHAADLDLLVVLRHDGVFAVEGADLGEAKVLEPLDPLTPAGGFEVLPEGARVGTADQAAELRDRATVLTAAFLLGISDAALHVARDYSLEREQFGQPIGTFQALKHMMADMFVRTNLARSATYAAAAVLDDPVVGHVGRSVSAAKLLAGEAAIDNARASVQVLGGMGFTWDMLPNYLLKRAWVLDAAFGASSSHALAISTSMVSESR